MTLPTFPASDLDTPETVQALLGSYWAHTYDGAGQVQDYVAAVCDVFRQADQDLWEAQESIVWRSVPLLHTVEWYPLTVLQSERLDANLTGLRFSSTGPATFGAAGAFGQPLPGAVQPAALGNVVDAPLLCDQITTPNAVLVRDVDYTINTELGAIQFTVDPFNDPRFSPKPIFDSNGNQTDSELVLWLYQAAFDEQNLQTQIGYVFGLNIPSTPAAQELVTALLDALQEGTAREQVEALLEAACGVQLVETDGEVVQALQLDARGWLVITSGNVYRYPAGANPLVSVGQTVNAGDALTDALQFLDLNSGVIPDGLSALAVGPAFLAPGYSAELIFANTSVPWSVTTDPYTNLTKLAAPLGGYPPDVALFWNQVHARGVTSGTTLADLLDTRTVKVGQPTAASLPATLNPLQFLVETVFRYGLAVAQINVAGMSPNGLGLTALRYLRRIVPPLEAVLVLIQLPAIQDAFTVVGTESFGSINEGMPALTESGTITLPSSDPIAIWVQTC